MYKKRGITKTDRKAETVNIAVYGKFTLLKAFGLRYNLQDYHNLSPPLLPFFFFNKNGSDIKLSGLEYIVGLIPTLLAVCSKIIYADCCSTM